MLVEVIELYVISFAFGHLSPPSLSCAVTMPSVSFGHYASLSFVVTRFYGDTDEKQRGVLARRQKECRLWPASGELRWTCDDLRSFAKYTS
jgi:hypothetical protein